MAFALIPSELFGPLRTVVPRAVNHSIPLLLSPALSCGGLNPVTHRRISGYSNNLATSTASSTNSSVVSNAAVTATKWANQRLSSWMQFYEDFVGLTEVRNAQQKVIQAERIFIQSQQDRRERSRLVASLQLKLKEIRGELDKTSRGEDRYLELVTQEHRLVKEERALESELSESETSERETFSLLSAAVRESHEKERARAERTKYWSVIGSVIGAIIGIIGTSMNNWLKMRDLQTLVTRSAASTAVPVENVAVELSSLAKTQHDQLQSFIQDLKGLLGEQQESAAVTTQKLDASLSSKDIFHAITEQRLVLLKEMQSVKDLIAARRGLDVGNLDAIVYVKHDLQEALDKTQQNMEWKMKINSIVTAAFLYTAFALSVPVLEEVRLISSISAGVLY